jgi:hypothetical protein
MTNFQKLPNFLSKKGLYQKGLLKLKGSFKTLLQNVQKSLPYFHRIHQSISENHDRRRFFTKIINSSCRHSQDGELNIKSPLRIWECVMMYPHICEFARGAKKRERMKRNNTWKRRSSWISHRILANVAFVAVSRDTTLTSCDTNTLVCPQLVVNIRCEKRLYQKQARKVYNFICIWMR